MTQIAKEAAAAGVPQHVMHTVEHTLSELLAVCGGCDRILGTPIPLSYTRHTSRSLVLWLSTLPFALWPVLGAWEQAAGHNLGCCVYACSVWRQQICSCLAWGTRHACGCTSCSWLLVRRGAWLVGVVVSDHSCALGAHDTCDMTACTL